MTDWILVEDDRTLFKQEAMKLIPDLKEEDTIRFETEEYKGLFSEILAGHRESPKVVFLWVGQAGDQLYKIYCMTCEKLTAIVPLRLLSDSVSSPQIGQCPYCKSPSQKFW
jgi:hypothetical protein